MQRKERASLKGGLEGPAGRAVHVGVHKGAGGTHSGRACAWAVHAQP